MASAMTGSVHRALVAVDTLAAVAAPAAWNARAARDSTPMAMSHAAIQSSTLLRPSSVLASTMAARPRTA